MNTVTHLLINAALQRSVGRHTGVEVPTRPFLWGAVAPDLPLIGLTIGSAVWYPLVHDWSLEETLRHAFGEQYLGNPLWQAACNLLHAPLMLLAGLLLAFVARRRWPTGARTVAWLLAGSVVHSAIDIPVHHDDGPLLLFPFEWTRRFASPISYWDADHYGALVGVVELVLMGALAAYVAWPWMHRRTTAWLARR